MAEKRSLTVESQYCSNWTVEDAIRELVQNAIDTGTKIDISRHDNSKWVIRDNGKGIQLSDFLVGRTSKSNDSEAIGQFGEGAPIGCLVLARSGRDVKVYSKGKRYAFSFEYDNQWGSQLLTVTIDDASIDKGTTVLVECSAEEMYNVQAKFLKLSPQPVLARTKGSEFLSCPGRVYVNGLEVTKIKSIFGYNFKGHKELVNRDRNAIGFSEVSDAIRTALESTTNIEIISHVIRCSQDERHQREAAEFVCDLRLQYPSIWKSAIKKIWGSRVCMVNGTSSDIDALENNWFVLQFPYGLRYTFNRYDILKFSSDALNNGRERVHIPLKELTQTQRDNFKEGRKIADWLADLAGLKPYPIRIFQDLKKDKGTHRYAELGRYHNGIVELEVGVLEYRETMIGTILHEYAHGTSNAEDFSRAFESCLTQVMAKLGMELYDRQKVSR